MAMGQFIPCKRNWCFCARSKAVRGPYWQAPGWGNLGQKAKMALKDFWKGPSLGAICLQSLCIWPESVGLGVGRGLSWPVAKPDVYCVPPHSMELSNSLPCWEFVCHSYDQLHPITEKVSKVLWAGPRQNQGGGRLAFHPLTPPCWGPFLCT